MSTLKVRREIHVYIGAVKVAEVCFRSAPRWKVYLRLMRNEVSYHIQDSYETVGDAFRDLHRLLNDPPPGGGHC